MLIGIVSYALAAIICLIINLLTEYRIWLFYPTISLLIIFIFLFILENQFKYIMRRLVAKYGNELNEEIRAYLRINAPIFIPMYLFKSNYIAKNMTASFKYIYIGLLISVILFFYKGYYILGSIFIIILIVLFFSEWKLRFYKGNHFDQIIATKKYLKSTGNNLKEMGDFELEEEMEKWPICIEFLNSHFNK